MGNSDSSLLIAPEKTVYVAGEIVRGTVALVIGKPLEAHVVYLRVKGVEAVEISRQVTHDGKTERKTYTAKRTILKVQIPLFTPRGTLMPGSYQVNFEFCLPPDLPSSLCISRPNKKASVTYKMKAICDVKGMFRSDIKSKMSFGVISQRTGAPPRPIASECTEIIKEYCCLTRGSGFLLASLLTDTYTHNEQLQVHVEARNNSSLKAKGIKISLVCRMEFRAHGHSETSTFVCSYVETDELIQPGESKSCDLQLPVAPPDGQNGFVPSTGPEIHNFRCSYHVEVKLRLGTFKPTLELPIQILQSPPAQPEPYEVPVAIPVDWSPQVISPVKLDQNLTAYPSY